MDSKLALTPSTWRIVALIGAKTCNGTAASTNSMTLKAKSQEMLNERKQSVSN